jgi:hypothetical protein
MRTILTSGYTLADEAAKSFRGRWHGLRVQPLP